MNMKFWWKVRPEMMNQFIRGARWSAPILVWSPYCVVGRYGKTRNIFFWWRCWFWKIFWIFLDFVSPLIFETRLKYPEITSTKVEKNMKDPDWRPFFSWWNNHQPVTCWKVYLIDLNIHIRSHKITLVICVVPFCCSLFPILLLFCTPTERGEHLVGPWSIHLESGPLKLSKKNRPADAEKQDQP